MPHTGQLTSFNKLWLDRRAVQVIRRDDKGTHLFLLDWTVQLKIDKLSTAAYTLGMSLYGAQQQPNHDLAGELDNPNA